MYTGETLSFPQQFYTTGNTEQPQVLFMAQVKFLCRNFGPTSTVLVQQWTAAVVVKS